MQLTSVRNIYTELINLLLGKQDAAPSLSNMFKTTAGQWTCDTCMIQNKSDATKCAACETKKPGAAPPGNDWINDTLIINEINSHMPHS